ncbi:hypothetical protein KV557_01510 [Kitasatospora aureofaciens]|uniref:hypothetical protein n=1 Tax=Kitasatospora aureofaciens TaxID=1894 RepID=UPI001C494B10|nr:hypothetical protein [Kitasatospora aureofaciens]MBV6695800.1 hypothetical protein [Kitasatospora aureofaciens]
MATATAAAVDQPLRRPVRLLPVPERPAAPERPEPAPAPAAAHDRTRPAHCRISMHFED